MFSDTRQSRKYRTFQRTSRHQYWLHNGVRVQNEMGHFGHQMENDLPRPDRKWGVGFSAQEHMLNARRNERTGTHFNGYSHQRKLPFDVQEHHVQLGVAGQSCPTKSNTARWTKSPEQAQKHSMSVRDYFRECGFVKNDYQTEPHPFERKCFLAPPTQFIGQENCRGPVCVEEQQLGYVKENYPKELYTSGWPGSNPQDLNRHHRLKPTFNYDQEYCTIVNSQRDLIRPMRNSEEGCNGSTSIHGIIFSTEVPHREVDNTKHQQSHFQACSATVGVQNKSSSKEQVVKKEPRVSGPKGSQDAVRNQIRRVVVDLEGVVRGLKLVHQEMKEVVEQIELLTSSIDLGEGEPSMSLPSDTRCSSSSSGVITGSHKRAGDDGDSKHGGTAPFSRRSPPSPSLSPPLSLSVSTETQWTPSRDSVHPQITAGPCPSAAPPLTYPHRDPGLRSERKELHSNFSTVSQGQGQTAMHRSSNTKGPRTRKPPPYPHNGKVEMASKGPLKAPPYPTKRRLLSTTV